MINLFSFSSRLANDNHARFKICDSFESRKNLMPSFHESIVDASALNFLMLFVEVYVRNEFRRYPAFEGAGSESNYYQFVVI